MSPRAADIANRARATAPVVDPHSVTATTSTATESGVPCSHRKPLVLRDVPESLTGPVIVGR